MHQQFQHAVIASMHGMIPQAHSLFDAFIFHMGINPEVITQHDRDRLQLEILEYGLDLAEDSGRTWLWIWQNVLHESRGVLFFQTCPLCCPKHDLTLLRARRRCSEP